MSQTNESKMISERDAVLRERAAANKAIEKVFELARKSGGIEHVDMRCWAENVFPLPKVTRRRVITVQHPTGARAMFQFRVTNGGLEWATAGNDDWGPFGTITRGEQRPEFLRALADLLANPTEEVGADA